MAVVRVYARSGMCTHAARRILSVIVEHDTRTRPVWRTYLPRFEANAAAHARAGGHAVVRHPRAWTVVLPLDADGGVGELTAWALLDLGIQGMDVPETGPAAGLATVRLPARLRAVVAAWCDRDATEPAATTPVTLDCRTCAACCRHNRVVLEDHDLARWHEAGRPELASRPYVRTHRGVSLLVVRRGGDCVHLEGNDCGIYALRPDNCRAFPAGSEPCLSARHEAVGALSPPG